jgi:heme/copper-type cytochrome/quinol oxidase subunit 2
VTTGVVLVAQARRDFDVVARRYTFTVSGSDRAEIHVTQNDLVRVNFSTEDIPHSFTIDDHDDSHYRIMRRAEAGKPVSFEFRADTSGRFRFYCSLTIDPKCKGMQGTLIVDPK